MSRQFTVEAPNGARVAAYDHPAPRGSQPGDPVLVLAHGWILAASTWHKVISLVQAQRNVRVISYDQPAHCNSTPGTTAKPTIGELGQALDSVITAAQPQGPVVVAGHSMGGMTIMAFARQFSHQLGTTVRGIGLIATAAKIEPGASIPGERAFMTMLSWLPKQFRFVPLPEQLVTLAFGPNSTEEDRREVAVVQARTRPHWIGRYYFALMEMDESASLEQIAKVPTRIVVGTKDRATPRRWSVTMGERIGVTPMVLEEKGHMLPYEAPEVVSEQLIELLDLAQAPQAGARS